MRIMITKVVRLLFVRRITRESKFSIVYVSVVVEKKTSADPPWYGFPSEEEPVVFGCPEQLQLEDRDKDTSDEDDADITMVAVVVVAVSYSIGDAI